MARHRTKYLTPSMRRLFGPNAGVVKMDDAKRAAAKQRGIDKRKAKAAQKKAIENGEQVSAYNFALAKSSYYGDMVRTTRTSIRLAREQGKDTSRLETRMRRAKILERGWGERQHGLGAIPGGRGLRAGEVFGTRKLSKAERPYATSAERFDKTKRGKELMESQTQPYNYIYHDKVRKDLNLPANFGKG